MLAIKPSNPEPGGSNPRWQALRDIEGAMGSLQFRLLAQPDETLRLCRELLQRLELLESYPLDFDQAKFQKRRDALVMALTAALAQGLVETGQWLEATEAYQLCLKLGEQFQVPEFQAESLIKLGRAHRHAGNLEVARLSYQRAAMFSHMYGLYTQQAEAIYQQAVVSELEQYFEIAKALYLEGLQLCNGQGLYSIQVRFLGQVGQLAQNEANYPEAVHYYRLCLQLLRETGSDVESEIIILNQLSRIFTETASAEDGIVAAQQGLQLARQASQFADVELFLTDLVGFYRLQENYPQAQQYARELKKIGLASGGRALQTAELMLEQIDQLSRTSPGTDELDADHRTALEHYASGNRYYRKGAYERAISAYSRALRIDPSLVDAFINRGCAYTATAHYDRALVDYWRAAQLDNTNPGIFFNRGNAYRKRREYKLALADYSRAIELAPTDPDAYFNRGEVLNRLGRRAEAATDFEQVLRLSEGRDEEGVRQARQILAELSEKT